jgi:hypothetical protein
MNDYQKGTYMNLLTYAVSRKLLDGNDMWRYVTSNKPIPQNIVEDAFKDVISTYEDTKAERLINDYNAFVAHHVPVTFTTVGSDVQVSGEIDDAALEIIETIHHKTSDDVVRQTVTSSIHTISPEREFTISDIEMMADDVMARAMANHEILHNVKPIVDIVDDEPGIYESESPTKTTSALEDAMTQMDELERKYGAIESKPTMVSVNEIEDNGLVVPELDDDPIDDSSISDINEPTTDTGLISSVWNAFVNDIREHKLDERLELTTPLTVAL